jgi:hypothetical protein
MAELTVVIRRRLDADVVGRPMYDTSPRVYSPQARADVLALLDALEAAQEAVRVEAAQHEITERKRQDALDDLEAARSEVAELRAALLPLAVTDMSISPSLDDDEAVDIYAVAGDVRRARAALGKERSEYPIAITVHGPHEKEQGDG